MANIFLWLVVAVIWSSAFAAIKLGVQTIEPMPLVTGRMLIGASILYLVLKLRGMSLSRDRATLTTYAISGLLGNVIPFLLLSYGEIHVDSGLAAILIGIGPVATVFLAHFFLPDEPLTPRTAIGIALGVLGLFVLIGPDALRQIGVQVVGQLAILCAAICYASCSIYVKLYAKRPALEMAAGSMLVGAGCVAFVAVLFDEFASMNVPATRSIIAMVYLGVFPTALATLIYFFLVPRIGASRISQVNFVVPVGGALIGVFLLGEELSASTLIALPIIVAAVYLVSARRNRGSASRKPAPSEAGLPAR